MPERLRDVNGKLVADYSVAVNLLEEIAAFDRDVDLDNVHGNRDTNFANQRNTTVSRDLGLDTRHLILSALPSAGDQVAEFTAMRLRAVVRQNEWAEVGLTVRVRLMDPTNGFQDFNESLATWNNPHPDVAAGGEWAAPPAPEAKAAISQALQLSGGIVEWDILALWNHWYGTLGKTGRIGLILDADIPENSNDELTYYCVFGEYGWGDPWLVIGVRS